MEQLHAQDSKVIIHDEEQGEELDHDWDDDGGLTHQTTGLGVDRVVVVEAWLDLPSEQFDEGCDSEKSEHFDDHVAVERHVLGWDHGQEEYDHHEVKVHVVPLVLEEALVPKSDESQQDIDYENSFENIVKYVQYMNIWCQEGNTVEKSQNYDKIADNFVLSGFHNFLKIDIGVDVIPELYPIL